MIPVHQGQYERKQDPDEHPDPNVIHSSGEDLVRLELGQVGQEEDMLDVAAFRSLALSEQQSLEEAAHHEIP